MPSTNSRARKCTPLASTGFVEGDDVLVAELGGVTGLAAVVLQRTRLLGHAGIEYLQSDQAAQLLVGRLVNRAHAAGGDASASTLYLPRRTPGLSSCEDMNTHGPATEKGWGDTPSLILATCARLEKVNGRFTPAGRLPAGSRQQFGKEEP